MDDFLTFNDFFRSKTPDEKTDSCKVCEQVDSCPLTMAYVPFQKFTSVYDNMTALNNGTLFPELDKPFTGKRNTR